MATHEQAKSTRQQPATEDRSGINGHQLDTGVTDGHERTPDQPLAPPAPALSTWLTVEQI